MRLKIHLYDLWNKLRIISENNTNIVQDFIDSTKIKVYSVSKLVEIKSINLDFIAV